MKFGTCRLTSSSRTRIQTRKSVTWVKMSKLSMISLTTWVNCSLLELTMKKVNKLLKIASCDSQHHDIFSWNWLVPHLKCCLFTLCLHFSADMMTNPLEVDDKESTQSISSSTSRHSDAQKSTLEKAKLKDQVSCRFFPAVFFSQNLVANLPILYWMYG